MEEEKELEKKLEQAFQKTGAYLPEDKYFKKIWHSIESRAPVGEKYYLRSIFSMLLVFLFFAIFIFFYTDFLSSVLTLKEIRNQNLKFYSTPPPFMTPRLKALGPAVESEISKGIHLSVLKHSNILLVKEDQQTVVLDFFNGHVVVDKASGDRSLIIRLPDVIVKMRQGKCNLFCYDNMIRIVPLSHPIEVETNGKKQTLKPGTVFYFLDKKEVMD